LIDLLLPSPVSKYLPSGLQLPLMHASALGLRYEAAADEAVQSILASTSFNGPRRWNDINTAVFYLSITPDATYAIKIQPYAVSGAIIEWQQHISAEAASATAAQIDWVDVGGSAAL
jgi:hypothetical protein